MNDRADMVIFHEPDGLEFARNGKSLGVVRANEAEPLFDSIRLAPKGHRARLIQNLFSHFLSLQEGA